MNKEEILEKQNNAEGRLITQYISKDGYIWKMILNAMEEYKQLEELNTLEVGWYQCKTSTSWICFFNGEYYEYGFDWKGNWIDFSGKPKSTLTMSRTERKISDKEAEEVLIKKGEKYIGKTIVNHSHTNICSAYDMYYENGELRYKISNIGYLVLMSKDGKWATIVKEKEYHISGTLSQLEKELDKLKG